MLDIKTVYGENQDKSDTYVQISVKS